MKKTLLLFSVCYFLFAGAFAQTIILSENFNSYDGTTANTPANWMLSYTGSSSYYTTSTSSGPSGPNSYKFGVDSATVITPQFTGADSLHFWAKGNGTDSLSSLTIYYTSDLINWYVLNVVNPIATTGNFFYDYSLPAGTQQLKFFYYKSLGNIAFDDFSVTSSTSGIINATKNVKPFSIYPSPSNGPVEINFTEPVKDAKFSIYNVIGGEIKNIPVERISNQKFKLDFHNLQPGYYFIRIQTDKLNYTTRITITALLKQKITSMMV